MGNNQKDFSKNNGQQKQTDKKNQPYEGAKQWSRKDDDDLGQDIDKKEDVDRDNKFQSDDEDADMR